MSNTAVKLGDRVRHSTRPEWGVGTVIKVEQNAANGAYTPRVTVRFPNTGIKVLAALPIPLDVVNDEDDAYAGEGEQTTALATAFESPDWLAPVAQKKALQAMTSLPMSVRDPFLSVRERLKSTLELYRRFDRTGAKLVDWAVAQTRMNDPLSRFTRQELEQYFDRWALERDSHLARLHEEARREPGMLEQVDELLRQAPPAARHALRQRNGGR
jgi:hypothetical protein